MAIAQPPTDDSSLNMTPMIDIVFQLILFFMFNLRFKALDHRIDTVLPRDRGPNRVAAVPEEIPSVRVALFRDRPEDPGSPTRVKVGGHAFEVPSPAWTGGPRDAAAEAERDRVFRSIEAKIVALNPKGDLKGRIDVPPPKGNAVPHADVVRVIDAFLGAGVHDVVFEGTRPARSAPPR
jgi:biopolymer transport protein ExbD